MNIIPLCDALIEKIYLWQFSNDGKNSTYLPTSLEKVRKSYRDKYLSAGNEIYGICGDDNSILGCIMLDGIDFAHGMSVANVFFPNKENGMALLKAIHYLAEYWFDKMNFSHFLGYTEATNKQARNFHKKIGFIELCTIPKMYHHGMVDGVVSQLTRNSLKRWNISL